MTRTPSTETISEVIDLGVLDAEPNEPRGPMFPPGMRRGMLAAGVALLCLLALGASAMREPGLSEPLWTGTVSLNGFRLGTDVVYSTSTDGHFVIARDLRTGRQLWQREVAEIPEISLDVGGGVTAVSTRPLDNQTGRPRTNTTFVRTRTGEEIGRTQGSPGQISIGGQPLILYGVRDDCVTEELSCLTLSGWDVAAGKVVWRTDLPKDAVTYQSTRDGLIDGLAAVNRDGTVELRDLASGSVLTSVRLPELADGGQALLLPRVLLTTHRTGTRVTLAGYERPSLARIWSAEVSVPGGDDIPGNGSWLGECGVDACLYTNGGAVLLVDPATGTVKARTNQTIFSRVGNGVFLAGAAGRNDTPTPTIMLVLDPSLRVLSGLSVGDPVWWPDNGTQALFTQPGKDRTGFVEIDEQGRQRLLGSVPGTELTCDARGQFVACVDHGGTLRVWRLPD